MNIIEKRKANILLLLLVSLTVAACFPAQDPAPPNVRLLQNPDLHLFMDDLKELRAQGWEVMPDSPIGAKEPTDPVFSAWLIKP